MILQTRYGHYESLDMSFGLTNASKTFLDLMNTVLWNYFDSFEIVFIDDMLVYSKSKYENIGHLRIVLDVLMEHQLFSKHS